MNVSPDPSQPSIIEWFAKNPLASLLLSALSILLTVLFYVLSLKHPRLVYLLNPAQTVIVNSKSAPTSYKCSINGEAIEGDVSLLDISFWNAGSATIRSMNIERPIIVHVPYRILEVRLAPTSRDDITGASIDTARADQGSLSFSWKLLEHNDGTFAQIVFAGPVGTRAIITGTIEEQGEITPALGRGNIIMACSFVGLMLAGFFLHRIITSKSRFPLSIKIAAAAPIIGLIGVLFLYWFTTSAGVPAQILGPAIKVLPA